MNWEPWATFRETVERLPIDEPPCKNCRYFRPHRRYSERGDFVGVRCCVANAMQSDFSCFEEKLK